VTKGALQRDSPFNEVSLAHTVKVSYFQRPIKVADQRGPHGEATQLTRASTH
jgi:hypothetical protein